MKNGPNERKTFTVIGVMSGKIYLFTLNRFLESVKIKKNFFFSSSWKHMSAKSPFECVKSDFLLLFNSLKVFFFNCFSLESFLLFQLSNTLMRKIYFCLSVILMLKNEEYNSLKIIEISRPRSLNEFPMQNKIII